MIAGTLDDDVIAGMARMANATLFIIPHPLFISRAFTMPYIGTYSKIP